MNLVNKNKLSDIFKKIIHDKNFRFKVESDPIATLSAEGIDVSDPAVAEYINKNIFPDDSALLADGQVKKIFAVSTGASIVVAVSTPAFPKGENDEGSEIDEIKNK